MNFLLRTTNSVAPDLPTILELHKDVQSMPKLANTLEGLIAEDPYPKSSSIEDGERDSDGGVGSSTASGPNMKNQALIGSHSDVSEDEGWITIPHKVLPENWNDAADIHSFRSLDRSFVFPGEQLHILACLSISKQDTEIITPFRVAAVMNKNGSPEKNATQPMKIIGINSSSTSGQTYMNGKHQDTPNKNIEENGETVSAAEKTNTKQDISATESLLRMEDHKQRTEIMLEKFRNSHFFVRIAESNEPLWSRRNVAEPNDGGSRKTSRRDTLNAFIDRGNFDGNASGGVARNTVRCCSLHNGDIVVLLQMNVGIDSVKDPILEILQFEKFQTSNFASENQANQVVTTDEDPCGELLRWLLPLDRALPPPGRPLSPPLGFGSGIGNASQRSTLAASSGSQLFSFGHFRSYSMPTLPQVSIPSSSAVPPSSTKPSFGLEDFDHFSPEKTIDSQDVGTERLLSFRGVSLEPERFSVHCGLEGLYIPGRRWRRKLEIIQPLEIHSFAAACNTEDLLCVQIKNVSPAHMPDIIIFLDAITIIFEEAPNGVSPISLPISCIEAGNDHSLPNLALRRGEEHSFILKPAIAMTRDHKGYSNKSSLPSYSQMRTAASNMHMISRVADGGRVSSSTDQYAVLVSCRCNYTESKLFFKKSTSWRPRIMRDLMVSVASEISEQTFGPNGRVSQLPVQVLTLQVSNLTSEDLTLTVLAPTSFTSPPSVVSLNSAPTTPMSPFAGFPEFIGRVGEDKRGSSMQRLSSMPVSESQKESDSSGARSISLSERTAPSSDVIPSTDLGCTHLWLQSTVPLGCVPAQSSATVKLELLPLTNGIITLDTLQVAVKEKGLTYIPEHSLKIHATSSIATEIV